MWNRRVVLALAGALAVATVLVAEPGTGGPPQGRGAMDMGGPGGPGMHNGAPEQHLLASLNLSQAQKDQLKTLRRARRDKAQATRNALRDAQEDLRDMLAKPDRSKDYADKLRAKHADVLKLETEQRQDRFESLLEIRAILTDEQLKKFVAMHEDRQGGGKGRGRRQGAGRPGNGGGPQDGDGGPGSQDDGR